MSTFTLRRCMVLVFLALYIFLGIPLWYKLTTVYRAVLPADYIKSLHNNKFQEVNLAIPVFIKSDVYRFPDIHDAVQIQVNHLLNSKRKYVDWSLQILPYNETLLNGNDSTPENYHVVDLVLDEGVGYYLLHDSKVTVVYFDDEAVASNDLPFFIAQTLVEHTFEIEWNQFSLSPGQTEPSMNQNSDMAIKYNPDIHLSITLLNGDGTPVDWDLDSTLKTFFTPFRQVLSPLVNFTIDTSIVYYNDLNLQALSNISNPTWHDLSHVIDLSELTSTNYYKEQNVLNLAIVFPSEKSTPQDGLQFIEDDGQTSWESFTIPQWGVLIVNKYPLEANSLLTESYLSPIVFKFIKDLLKLLGIVEQNNNNELISPYSIIDSFKRLKTIQNLDVAIETLWSLVKLTEQFQQMAIPREVLNNVRKALDLRLEVIDLLNNPLKGDDAVWNEVLVLSNQVVKFSENAFFHGEMVKQNFFPQEHKVAVYLPLLGPISVVIITGLIANLKEKKDNEDDEHDDAATEFPSEKSSFEKQEQEELKEAEELNAVDDEDYIKDSSSSL